MYQIYEADKKDNSKWLTKVASTYNVHHSLLGSFHDQL
jgi:hypothetical protein